MAAIVFPLVPVIGDIYPPGAGVAGESQWKWDGSKWNTVPVFIRLSNQQAYNSYVWPNTKAPTGGFQLTDNLADGILSWQIPGGPLEYLDDISSQFDGTTNIFTLDMNGTPFTPNPSTSLIIVLGGIVQNPGNAYTISGAQIAFSLAPPLGASFAGISSSSN